MSYIEPPTLTNLRKRKRSSRSASVASSAGSHLPRDAIDPHSYGPSTRKQLNTAGLSHTDHLPGDYIFGFPHRPLPGGFGEESEAKNISQKKPPGVDDKIGNFDDDLDEIDTDESENTNESEPSLHETTEDEGGDQVENAARLAAKWRKIRRREARRRRNALRMQRAYDQNVGVLSAIVQRGLQEAEHGTMTGGSAGQAGPIGINRAKRAFGLLVRTQIRGKPLDLRQNYFWAMGAEVLMREDEDKTEGGSIDNGTAIGSGQRSRRRWGLAANLPRVRAYYEDLIQQYPYNRLWPRSVSALTFWPAMVGTELYSIYAEAQLASERLDGADGQETDERQLQDDMRLDSDDGDDDDVDGNDLDHEFYDESYGNEEEDDDGGANVDRWANEEGDKHSNQRHRHRIHRQRNHPNRLAREEIRLAALNQIRDLARRMDAVMANMPYNSSPEMLRLRGMIALYMGDLALVTPPRTRREVDEGERLRTRERASAQARFARLLEVDRDIQSGVHHKKGGVSDTVVDAYVEEMAHLGRREKKPKQRQDSNVKQERSDDDGANSSEEEDDASDTMERPIFTSLPIRSPR